MVINVVINELKRIASLEPQVSSQSATNVRPKALLIGSQILLRTNKLVKYHSPEGHKVIRKQKSFKGRTGKRQPSTLAVSFPQTYIPVVSLSVTEAVVL